MRKSADMKETFKQGLGGGILGAFIGAPGLGIVIGMAHANKDKLKSFPKKFDSYCRGEKK